MLNVSPACGQKASVVASCRICSGQASCGTHYHTPGQQILQWPSSTRRAKHDYWPSRLTQFHEAVGYVTLHLHGGVIPSQYCQLPVRLLPQICADTYSCLAFEEGYSEVDSCHKALPPPALGDTHILEPQIWLWVRNSNSVRVCACLISKDDILPLKPQYSAITLHALYILLAASREWIGQVGQLNGNSGLLEYVAFTALRLLLLVNGR